MDAANDRQIETYQAFLTNEDGQWSGYVREIEDGRSFRLLAEIWEQAFYVLARSVSTWAHNHGLSRLPTPLPFEKERPERVTAMGPIEVVYIPQN